LLFVATLAFALAAPVRAQLPDKLSRCLPYPTFAQEVSAQRGDLQPPPIVFDEITFDPSSTGLSPADRDNLVATLRGASVKAEPDWLDQARHVAGSFLQDRGYFKADLSLSPQQLKTDSDGEHVALTITLFSGAQYRMGGVAFRSADPAQALAFSDQQLRDRYYLKDGDVFAASAIRKSLEALRRLYGAHGYIDFVATPITEINESTHRLDVTMEIDQGKAFRVGTVTVDTASEKARSAILAAIPPGATFNTNDVPKALEDNAALLPADVSMQDVELHRDVTDGTVNLTFHLRSCPTVTQ
jgi:outer membrane translocation and assembly module TamA